MPRVSVIVAARDAAGTLPEALASVVGQTYADWEIVVADDASSDATAAIAAGFPRTRVVATGGPLGPGGARNAAARAATGELLATLDADDAWEPELLATQVAAHDAAGAGVGLVTCDAQLVGVHGALGETFSQRVGSAAGLTLDRLLETNLVFTSVLVPRAVFERMGGYEASLPQAEDYDLWLRIVEEGLTVVHTPRALARYRLRDDSLTASSPQAAEGTAAVLERALARGRLTPRQRRIARRQARLQRLTAERARIALAAAAGERVLGRRLRAAPATARVALEHPGRWGAWLRRGARPAARGRHG